MGDMKMVERPQSQNIGLRVQITVHAFIKVSFTKTGHIFGTIVCEDTATREKVCDNLNDIHMVILWIPFAPQLVPTSSFDPCVPKFECGHFTPIPLFLDFLNHVVESTTLRCLAPHDTSETGSFLAANLYARSFSGEDALVSASVEKKDDNDSL